MDDRFNTIAGWVLGAGIVALGASIVAGEIYKPERPETMGYPIEGVVEEGAGGADAEPPIATLMASADAAAGEQVFKKCAACHNADKGGGNALGPNLYGVMGETVGAGHGGYPFSDALKSKGGNWDFQTMSDWLKSPRSFAPGTKMTFAGLSKPEDRANIIAFLNARSDSPLPLPAAPAASPEVAAAEAADAVPGKATDQPEMTTEQAAQQPAGNIGGDAAPAAAQGK